MNCIDVVGAVIGNEAGEILCARRSQQMSLPGLWEFPGGKVEPEEDPKESLRREIREELGCDITVDGLISDTRHDYPAISIRLMTYRAVLTSGTPVAREHAEVRWVPLSGLQELPWAPADIPTVTELLRRREK